MKINIVLAIVLLLGFGSCKKESGPGFLELNFIAEYQGENFELGEVYEDHLGHRIKVEILRTYISNIKAIDLNGEKVDLLDIALWDYENSDALIMQLDKGAYQGFEFGIGVPKDLNKDRDPNQYPNDHPLSVAGSETMFWYWNAGYIFTKYEGKVDLEGEEGNELLNPFAFHCGEDFLYQTHEANKTNFYIDQNETTTIDVVFNVDQFLKGTSGQIDLEQDFLTHTSGNVELAQRFTTLFNEAIEVVND